MDFLSSTRLAAVPPSYMSIVVVGALSALFASMAVTFFSKAAKNSFPYINPPNVVHKGSASSSTIQFRDHAKELISKGFKKFSGPFNLNTETGPLLVLGPDQIDNINHEKNLDFIAFNERMFLSHLDTFKSFAGGPPGMFQDAVRKSLTRSLPKFTQSLSDEMSLILQTRWGDSNEWKTVTLKEEVVRMVAQLSARIFVGPELGRDPEWIRITSDYTVAVFLAVQKVKEWPAILRPIVQYILPLSREARAESRRCEKMMRPILDQRARERAEAQKNGEKPPFYNDSIDWFEDAAKGRAYDDANLQLGLSMAAIHTTSDLLTQALYNLCAHPEALQPMREEAMNVLKTSGWQKTALYDLKLVDSFFKETQRMKPIIAASMSRRAIKDVELPGGIKIPKGGDIAVSAHRLWSEEYFEDADKFDPFRFARRRDQPGYEHKSVLAATSTDFTAFGHGKHACPGRFFAANEVKIALVHIILKYDMRLVEKEAPKVLPMGVQLNTNPFAKIEFRRRQEEFDLDSCT